MAFNKFGFGFVIGAEDQASPVVDKVGRSFGGLTKGITDGAARQEAAMRRVALGMAMVYGSAKVLRGIQGTIGEAGKFGVAIAEVSTLVDEATFSTQKMRDITMDMANVFGGDATMQAKALYQTISAGVSDSTDAINLLDTANRLAVGGVTDITTAVDGLTTMTNAYSTAGLTASDASDAFFVAIKAGKTNAQELSSTVGRLAPIMSSVGVASDEMLASIAAVTTQGIKTSEAVSGLKAAMANVLKPTADAQKEAKKLGIEFSQQGLKKYGGFVGLLQEIQGNSKFTEDSFKNLFSSVEGLNSVLALTANGGEKVNEILGQMQDKSGATKEAFDKMSKTFSFQSKRFEGISGNIKKLVGESFERLLGPVMKLFVTIASGIEKVMKSLPPEARDILAGVVGGLASMIGLIGGITLLSGVLGTLGISFGGLVRTLITFPLIVGPVVLLLGGLAVAAYAAYRAVSKNTGGLGASLTDLKRKVGLAWQGMIAIFKGEEFSKALQADLDKAENKGVLAFLRGFERFLERMKFWWEGLKRGFEEGVDALSESSALKGLIQTFKDVFGVLTGEGMTNSQELLAQWGESGASAGKRLASLGEVALNVASKLVKLIGTVVEWIGTISAEDLTTGIDNAVTSFKGLWEVLGAIGDAIGFIVKIVKSVVNGIQILGAALGETLGGIVSGAGGIWDYITADSAAEREAISRRRAIEANRPLKEAMPETTRQVGDLMRVWDPEDTTGIEKEIAKKNRVQDLESLRNLRSRTASLIKDKAAAGKQTTEEVELLRSINKAISSREDKPIKVMIDAEDMAGKIRIADNSHRDRSLDDLGVTALF